ncbi:SPFH domain / Band 7 family protein [Planctomycetes bacterium Poly30]|uniref:SPFH domain / Band 7 family protein n=1 Tax=Saltatorellus ferox TaxID=2528018 RepID=A0A518ELW0_9BACT|nr:SPFH domain / Band 7 family protein [Planctomycetes bacterium Poly30]
MTDPNHFPSPPPLRPGQHGSGRRTGPRTPGRPPRLTPSWLEWMLGLGLAALAVAYWLNATSSTGTVFKVEDRTVAAIVHAFDGTVTLDDTPGYRVIRPFLEDGYSVIKTPAEYRMTGNELVGDHQVPRLGVRAADGSNAWFEDVRIQYAPRPERAWDVLRTSGGDHAWRHGVIDAYARACLRDALGLYTAEEIVRQENLRAARLDATRRLDTALEPHGLRVLELTISSPAFPKKYEFVIQRRQVAEQEAQKITQELQQLRASRADRIAKLERDKALERTRMRTKIAGELAAARQSAYVERSSADFAYEARIRAGERERLERTSQADALVAKYEAEAAGVLARAEALAAEGSMAVRKALVESLKNVKFEIAPLEHPADDRARKASRNL